MAVDWEGVRSEVAAALGEVGFNAVIRRTVATVPNPDKPWETSSAVPVDTPVRIVSDSFDFDEVDGSVIQSRDRKIMMEAGPIMPEPSDNLIIDGVSHEIVAIMPTDPGGVAVLYEMQCRS